MQWIQLTAGNPQSQFFRQTGPGQSGVSIPSCWWKHVKPWFQAEVLSQSSPFGKRWVWYLKMYQDVPSTLSTTDHHSFIIFHHTMKPQNPPATASRISAPICSFTSDPPAGGHVVKKAPKWGFNWFNHHERWIEMDGRKQLWHLWLSDCLEVSMTVCHLMPLSSRTWGRKPQGVWGAIQGEDYTPKNIRAS